MRKLPPILLIAISLLLAADFATAAGGADSWFPPMRAGGYVLHVLAIPCGIMGFVLAKEELMLFGKPMAFAAMPILFLFVLLLGYSLAFQQTTSRFAVQVPLAIKSGSVAGIPSDFDKCLKGASPISARVVGGSGLVMFYLLVVGCEEKSIQIVAKRHPTSWVYFMDAPENTQRN